MNSNEVQFKAKSITWNKGDKEGQDKMRKSGLECTVSINTEQTILKIQGKIETVIRGQLN